MRWMNIEQLHTHKFTIDDFPRHIITAWEANYDTAPQRVVVGVIETRTRLPVDWEFKCGGCNWTTGTLYVHASSRKEALELIESGDAGCCSDCYSDMLAEESEG